MALVLIATPKALNANTYATRAEADAYHESHVANATWSAFSDATKEAALAMATRLLDSYVVWRGGRTDTDQALYWPRTGLTNRDGVTIDEDTIPQFIINATSEMARQLAVTDLTADADTKGFSEIAVGPIKLKIDKADAERVVLSDVVMSYVGDYASGAAVSSNSVKLARV